MVGVPTSAVKTASSAACVADQPCARYCGWISFWFRACRLARSSRPARAFLILGDAIVEMRAFGLWRPASAKGPRSSRPRRRRRRVRACNGARDSRDGCRPVRSLHVGGQKLLVREVGAEHQQHVARVHGGIAGRESDEAGHADVVGIVVFHKCSLPPSAWTIGLFRVSASCIRRSMRPGAAPAAEERDAFAAPFSNTASAVEFPRIRQAERSGAAGSKPGIG